MTSSSTGTRDPAGEAVTDPSPTPEAGGTARRAVERWYEPLTYLVTLVVTCVATFFALGLSRADLTKPFTYWGDAVAVAAHMKTTLEQGWYEYQPLLGAPSGQTYHDFPTADNLHLVVVRLLGAFTDSWPVVFNVYYIIGFPLAALAMVWFLRQCGVSRAMTVALAVLFAVAPYHFMRSQGHMWLASYYALPLALVVVVRALRGDPLWTRGRGPRAVSWLTGRGAGTALSLVLLTTSSTYYGVFVVILIGFAGAAAWLRERDWRRFGGAVVAGIVVVGSAVANMAPDLLYARAHGPSAAGLVRNAAEVEIYALKLSQLLLPVPGHRVDLLAHLRSHYDSLYPLASERPSLGIVAASGLVAAFVVTLLALTGRGRTRQVVLTDEARRTRRTLSHLSALVLVAFLLSTVGGIATFVSFLTASLRGWNRMSILIAALCLAIVGVLLDAALRRVRSGPVPRAVVAGGVAGVVLIVGYADQVTGQAGFDYPTHAAGYDADARWIETVESELPAGAMVFQLPYAGFPETAPVNGVFDTDQLKPYLHSDTLRWSGGAIKGRASTDWAREAAALPPDEMVASLAAADFAAIMVDRTALGSTAPELERGLVDAAGAPVAESVDGRFALYRIDDERADLVAANGAARVDEVGESVVEPVVAYPTLDVSVTPDVTGGTAWTFLSPEAVITLDNAADDTVRVRLTAEVAAGADVPEVVLLLGTGTVSVPMTAGSGTLDATVDIPAGQTTLELAQPSAGVALNELTVERVDVPALTAP